MSVVPGSAGSHRRARTPFLTSLGLRRRTPDAAVAEDCSCPAAYHEFGVHAPADEARAG